MDKSSTVQMKERTNASTVQSTSGNADYCACGSNSNPYDWPNSGYGPKLGTLTLNLPKRGKSLHPIENQNLNIRPKPCKAQTLYNPNPITPKPSKILSPITPKT